MTMNKEQRREYQKSVMAKRRCIKKYNNRNLKLDKGSIVFPGLMLCNNCVPILNVCEEILCRDCKRNLHMLLARYKLEKK